MATTNLSIRRRKDEVTVTLDVVQCDIRVYSNE